MHTTREIAHQSSTLPALQQAKRCFTRGPTDKRGRTELHGLSMEASYHFKQMLFHRNVLNKIYVIQSLNEEIP